MLALDTRVYVAAALRLCNAPVLPLGHARAARAIAETAAELHAAAAGVVDLAPVVESARALEEALRAREDSLARSSAGVNRTLMRLSRALIPLLYTTGDRFAHDLAVGIPPLAGLQPTRGLAALDPASDSSRFAVAALVRERNRVLHTLDEAAELVRELASAGERS